MKGSLAEKQKISVSHLSKLINSFSNYNFSDYINSLRIEQAKKLLDDDSFDQYTIVAIGLESGFNSKSTFYNNIVYHIERESICQGIFLNFSRLL